MMDWLTLSQTGLSGGREIMRQKYQKEWGKFVKRQDEMKKQMVAKASELKREGREKWEKGKKGKGRIKLVVERKTFFLSRSFTRKTWNLTSWDDHEEWILIGKSTFFFSYERYSIRFTMCVCGSWNGNFLLFTRDWRQCLRDRKQESKEKNSHRSLVALSPHFLFLTSSDLVFRSSWCLTVHEAPTLSQWLVPCSWCRDSCTLLRWTQKETEGEMGIERRAVKYWRMPPDKTFFPRFLLLLLNTWE